ncbi:anti-sigma factor family protein [Desulfobacter curvatus]|uniref:anti-sigma factor family protein n=1 Tax=Desulfobacter curvatus TaxID=2290 RepID=UPI0003803E50|nr:zf-HC2 domain-containing protein [Desulfobacter curvatus]
MNPGCIETVKLYDYITGQLSEQEARNVEDHLADCDTCLEQFVTAQALLEDTDLMENSVRTKEVGAPIIKALLAGAKRFLEWTVEPLAQPAFAIRDSAAESTFEGNPPSNYLKIVKRFGRLSGEMAFKKIKQNAFDLQFKLVGTFEKNERFCLILERENDKFDARILEDTRAEFTNLSFDRYHLVLEQNEKPCGKFFFEITRDGIYEQPDDSS